VWRTAVFVLVAVRLLTWASTTLLLDDWWRRLQYPDL
jgi:hypothetical protein